MKKTDYIKKLKIPVHELDGIKYIRPGDLDKVLNKKQRKQFSEYFGIQTMILLDDNTPGLYLHDCESALVRIFTGRLSVKNIGIKL